MAKSIRKATLKRSSHRHVACGVFGVLSVLSVDAAAYRTGADLSELPDGALIRWDTAPKYQIHIDGAPLVSFADVEKAVLSSAAESWTPTASGASVERFESTAQRAVLPGVSS